MQPTKTAAQQIALHTAAEIHEARLPPRAPRPELFNITE
jgi:hypothetical protein